MYGLELQVLSYVSQFCENLFYCFCGMEMSSSSSSSFVFLIVYDVRCLKAVLHFYIFGNLIYYSDLSSSYILKDNLTGILKSNIQTFCLFTKDIIIFVIHHCLCLINAVGELWLMLIICLRMIFFLFFLHC
jgi:hypothetical protein